MLAALLLPLLLQAPLPARPAADTFDSAYSQRLTRAGGEASWSWEALQELRPVTPAQSAALARWMSGADAAELRLAAVLAAGAEDAAAWESFAIGVSSLDEATAVACLLAPRVAPPEWWPALAYAASRPTAPLAVRAAAVARLLEAGCWEVWPIARSMLRTGTAADEAAPWADWQRGGRYELPKRILIGALDGASVRSGHPPSGIEPNAAWAAQVAAIAAFEARAQEMRVALPPPAVSASGSALWEQACAGDPAARAAVLLLGRAFDPLLRAELASGVPERAALARALLMERPR